MAVEHRTDLLWALRAVSKRPWPTSRAEPARIEGKRGWRMDRRPEETVERPRTVGGGVLQTSSSPKCGQPEG